MKYSPTKVSFRSAPEESRLGHFSVLDFDSPHSSPRRVPLPRLVASKSPSMTGDDSLRSAWHRHRSSRLLNGGFTHDESTRIALYFATPRQSMAHVVVFGRVLEPSRVPDHSRVPQHLQSYCCCTETLFLFSRVNIWQN